MDFAAKNKSSCLLFLVLIVCSGFVGVIQAIAIEDHPDRTFGYGVQIPGNVKIPGRAITSFLPAYRLPPINVTRVLTTCHDWQTSVSVKVYEGDSIAGEGKREQVCARYYEEAEICDDFDNIEDPRKKGFCEYLDLSCHFLPIYYKHFGNLELHGIPPAPRGSPQFEVTFALKEDKRLHVSVTDKGTMKSNSTSFTYGIARHMKLWAQQMDGTFKGYVINEVDPTQFPATRNYVDPDAVCL